MKGKFMETPEDINSLLKFIVEDTSVLDVTGEEFLQDIIKRARNGEKAMFFAQKNDTTDQEGKPGIKYLFTGMNRIEAIHYLAQILSTLTAPESDFNI